MTAPRWLGALCATLAALLALALAPAASASCAPLPPLEKALAAAEVVFVGTVTHLEHDGRVATFRVEEVRKGVLGSTVVVNGSGVALGALEEAEREGLGIGSSVGRGYQLGVRYLVVPHGASRELLLDNACSATRPYGREIEVVQPPVEAAPTPPLPKPFRRQLRRTLRRHYGANVRPGGRGDRDRGGCGLGGPLVPKTKRAR
jgi:hypothetical protein